MPWRSTAWQGGLNSCAGAFGRLQGVDQQHGDGHRAHTAGHRGDVAGHPLNVDEIELEGLADIDSTITAKGRGSVREILRQILDPLEMTYIVNESNIELTTKDNANEEPRIRFYDLSYILPNSANLTALTAATGQSVAPLDWDTQGGQSTMSIVGSMMIVSAPDMTHHRIEMMLSNISKMNPRNAAQAAQFGSQGGSVGAAMGPAANSGGLGGGLGGGMF